MFDLDGTERACTVMNVIQSEPVPTQASDIHHVTTDIANRTGFKLATAVGVMNAFLHRATIVLAHNLDFDERIMATAYYRAGKEMVLPAQRVCTCELAEPVLRLPPTVKMVKAGFGKKFKKPSLGECYKAFFGHDLEGAHDALVDCRAAARVYFHIVNEEARLYRSRPWFYEFLRRRFT